MAANRPRKLRTIAESEQYARESAALDIAAPKLDEILSGITFIVARYPEAGETTDQPGVRAVGVYPTIVSPALLVYYTFDADTVTLLSIVEDDEWDQGA